MDVENNLSAQEAARRLARNGPNELRAAPRAPAWQRVLAQFQEPPIYLLLAAVAIALLAWWVEGRVGWPVDAIVIAAVVLLNGVIGRRPVWGFVLCEPDRRRGQRTSHPHGAA